MSRDSLKPRAKRRSYSKQFKAEMVAQSLEGNVALASLAVHHGMNPNVLHRWVTEHKRYGKHSLDDTDSELDVQIVPSAPTNWLAVPIARDVVAESVPRTSTPNHKQPAQGLESIKLSVTGTDGLAVQLHWPVKEASQLAGFVRALLT